MSQHQAPKKTKTLLSFFKRKAATSESNETLIPNLDTSRVDDGNEQRPSKVQRVVIEESVVLQEVDATSSFELDPGLRVPIFKYPVDQQEVVRMYYLSKGPTQPCLKEKQYPSTKFGKQGRRFKYNWFLQFPWLEYSIKNDKAYCFYCFIFETNPPKRPEFSIEGFTNWKKVNDGKNCAFLQHEGGPCSPHRSATLSCENFMNSSRHIDNMFKTQCQEELANNRLLVKAIVQCIQLLALRGISFRGHDESTKSKNSGNFKEVLKFAAMLNEKVAELIGGARRNAKYTSPKIQRELLNIYAEKVRKRIREEVGDAKFCILVDEAQDSSNKEQMAIVIRFVDSGGFVRERFLGIVGVKNTCALTLKEAISNVLARHNLLVTNLRGQGYDGASNMRGQWNGLQALFLKECPYAYYVHCFAHRLQLALVAASKDVSDVWLFFSKLASIVNLHVSPKRKAELQEARQIEIDKLVASGEIISGRGANQVSTLQRAGDTRWGSHFESVSSLIELFGATCTVLESVMENGSSNSMRGEAKGALIAMRNFEFVFLFHLMHKIMGITNLLCQALQEKSQDILNAINLVSSTKALLQELRESSWDTFLRDVISFCERYDIAMLDMGARYMAGTGRSCQQRDYITVEHHYHFDIFNAVIDYQLLELKNRFPDEAIELLSLSSALDPSAAFKSFDIDAICKLADVFYCEDFTKQEIYILRSQLQHYKIDVVNHALFQKMSTISELCQGLVETKKSKHYFLIDRLIRLILTLPVSTATTERAFSAMKIVKTRLRNKMGDVFLADCMTVYMEREFAEEVDLDGIVDEFIKKPRKVKFR